MSVLRSTLGSMTVSAESVRPQKRKKVENPWYKFLSPRGGDKSKIVLNFSTSSPFSGGGAFSAETVITGHPGSNAAQQRITERTSETKENKKRKLGEKLIPGLKVVYISTPSELGSIQSVRVAFHCLSLLLPSSPANKRTQEQYPCRQTNAEGRDFVNWQQ